MHHSLKQIEQFNDRSRHMKMNEIDKKLGEINFSDLGLKGHGSELDRDDLDSGFKETRMFLQLGKIVDSRGNPNPLDTVKTDDGKTVKVSPTQAQMIMRYEQGLSQQGGQKDKFMRMIQMSDGLEKAKEMVDRALSKNKKMKQAVDRGDLDNKEM